MGVTAACESGAGVTLWGADWAKDDAEKSRRKRASIVFMKALPGSEGIVP